MSQPTFINIPQPPSQPDTPSEMPGTPTSTTTSLSALSTTAIKDGHRGAAHHAPPHRGGHQHTLSTTSLEAERADRISRLTGLSGIRGPPQAHLNGTAAAAYQSTPTSAAYFDAAGQPVGATKMSTVGSASATESIAGGTTTGEGDTETGGGDESVATGRDMEEIEMEDSASGYMGGEDREGRGMYEDENEMMATRSTGTGGGGFFDMDRMSDDGSASLVGFGEGAGSTVSGPIYQRRAGPVGAQGQSSAGVMGWGLERSSSGLSEALMTQGRREAMMRERERGGDTDTPVSQAALQERREALMVDGVSMDGPGRGTVLENDDVFVDTSTRGPVPVVANVSAIRETQQPGSHQQIQQQQQQQQHQQGRGGVTPSSVTGRETAERILRERLDNGEARVGSTTLSSPKGNEPLGRFYFEERK